MMALVADSTMGASVLFQDRNGGEAHALLRFSFDTTPDEALATVELAISLIHAIVDCRASDVRMFWSFHDPDAVATGDAEASQLLALFYTNGTEYAALYLPGARADYMEQEGYYAGIRLDMGNEDVVAAVLALSEMLVDTVLPNGSAWPDTFMVGGIVL